TGRSIPDLPNAHRLERDFGIPTYDWEQPPPGGARGEKAREAGIKPTKPKPESAVRKAGQVVTGIAPAPPGIEDRTAALEQGALPTTPTFDDQMMDFI